MISSTDDDEDAGSTSVVPPQATSTPPNPATSASGTVGPEETSATDTDPDPSGTGSSDTGEDLCGNGELDDGEICDDGNVDAGDQCTPGCTAPFEIEWTANVDGPASATDTVRGVATDADGNVYAAGFYRTATSTDAFVQQFGPDGTEGWLFTYASEMGLSDAASAIGMLPGGDIVIAGSSETVEDDVDWISGRIASTGDAFVWFETYDADGAGETAGSNFDAAFDLAVGSGDVFAAAGRQTTVDGRRGLVRTMNANGDEQWSDSVGDGEGSNDCDAVAVDGVGNVYASCTVVTEEGVTIWVRKYDPSGAELWTETVPQVVRSLAVDAEGNLIVAGNDSAGNITKYNGEFTEQWSLPIQHSGAASTWVQAVAADADGNVYFVGHIGVAGEQDNVYVGRVDADGSLAWTDSYNNDEANLGDLGFCVTIAADRSVIVGGTETVLGQSVNGFVRKYSQP